MKATVSQPAIKSMPPAGAAPGARSNPVAAKAYNAPEKRTMPMANAAAAAPAAEATDARVSSARHAKPTNARAWLS